MSRLPTTLAWFFGGWAMFKDADGNEWGLHSPVREVVASAN